MKHSSCFSFLHCAPRRAILFLGCLLLAIPVLADTVPARTLTLSCHPPKTVDAKKYRNSEAFNQALAAFSAEMASNHGFDQQDLDCILNQARHNPTVIRRVKPFPAGTPKNWQVYRARFIESVRITAGAKFWARHKNALEKAEKIYGVPPEIVVGIIGIETTYGKNKGNFRIIDALATLAFDYPEHPKRDARLALFRNELESTLLLSSERGIDPMSLKGSYAGAIGWPQFLPSSIRKYAVDFDGDGKIDLRHSPVDAIGSVANFLAQHGWKKGEPVVFPAELQADCPRSPDTALNQGLAARLTLNDLRDVCVTPKSALPENVLWGLVDLQNGFDATEYWLGTDNFFAITHYNRSYFYAMSVIDLGQAVRAFREQNRIK
ncbi:lytic murein transglycosylase B [Oxalobacter vibrioformis]|uniref:Lytic murein transglycosylase B n=1 Tax=Oxalobacter vibrioformis TaxID=933080 RepID=A0A9E9P4E5_9BURK|nr:lytic murein transglycosylase B [Oxalobacter vibrioformis]WAW11190.1 lytic murein transglycosylase B [Oxalobacter vibrioformis]